MKIKCPVCKKESEWEGNPFRPFCSERCKLIDLGAWASEEYKIDGRLEDELDKILSEPEKEKDHD
ncbi:MAG: DNA gyrase inhibitor YacG [Nitrospirae bacterium]|nr:DNA gyrase inhibitor YacG [Nitrospirota bacterium]